MITRWLHEDSIEYVIASTYASGKGYFFETLFGWRQNKKGNCKMVFSKKDWKKIDEMIEYYNTFVNKDGVKKW